MTDRKMTDQEIGEQMKLETREYAVPMPTSFFQAFKKIETWGLAGTILAQSWGIVAGEQERIVGLNLWEFFHPSVSDIQGKGTTQSKIDRGIKELLDLSFIIPCGYAQEKYIYRWNLQKLDFFGEYKNEK